MRKKIPINPDKSIKSFNKQNNCFTDINFFNLSYRNPGSRGNEMATRSWIPTIFTNVSRYNSFNVYKTITL